MAAWYSLFLFISLCVFQSYSYNFTTKYIEVPVDQFSFSSSATFKLRYLVNDSYFDDSGPIFFYTGNEGDVTLFSQNTGFIFDIAPTFNALIVFAEHRYYGESLPFGNESFSSPDKAGYLTTQQALADFVDVINELQKTYSNNNEDLPVVAFGGSYGGMLSSWFRMKYPHIVIGALASSAPIWQFEGITPCGNFDKIVTDVYNVLGTSACSDGIKKSWNIIRNLTKSESGKTEISNLWKLCKPLNTSQEVDSFIEWLDNLYVNLAMVNYPYPNSFLAPVPANPVKEFCNRFVEGQSSDLLKALEYATEIYSNYTQDVKCNDLDAYSQLGIEGWNFQACTEIIMPMCSTDEDMFENYVWNYEAYAKQCFELTGITPRSENFILEEYGGQRIEAASNIIFSNGLLDPWSQGGVLRNISSTVIAVVIPDSAHHLDLRAANPNDPDTVVEARKFYVQQIQKWIDEFYDNRKIVSPVVHYV